MACRGPAVKSRGQGRVSCTDTSPQLHLSILVPNSFVIDCLLSCLGLFECSVLTWPPPGEVPVTCLRGGYSPNQGGGQNTPGHWDCLGLDYGYVFANAVRYIIT